MVFAILQTFCNTESAKSIAARASVFTWRRELCRFRCGCLWRLPNYTRRSTHGCTAERFPMMMMTIAPSSPSRTGKLKPWRATFPSSCRSLGLKSLRASNFPFSFHPIQTCRLAAPRLSFLPFPDSSVSDGRESLRLKLFSLNQIFALRRVRFAKRESLKNSRNCLKIFNHLKFMKKLTERKKRNRRLYLAVISSVALSCGNAALAQTNVMAVATNSVVSDTSTNVANLGNITVVGQLDQARSQIVPNLGATAYTHTAEQIRVAIARRQRADQPGDPALAGRGAGFGGERRSARARRARESAISHQRRAAAGRHHGFWIGTRPALY